MSTAPAPYDPWFAFYEEIERLNALIDEREAAQAEKAAQAQEEVQREVQAEPEKKAA